MAILQSNQDHKVRLLIDTLVKVNLGHLGEHIEQLCPHDSLVRQSCLQFLNQIVPIGWFIYCFANKEGVGITMYMVIRFLLLRISQIYEKLLIGWELYFFDRYILEMVLQLFVVCISHEILNLFNSHQDFLQVFILVWGKHLFFFQQKILMSSQRVASACNFHTSFGVNLIY